MNDNLVRLFIAGLAAVVSGAMLTVVTTYVIAVVRHGVRGSLLIRHVIEVTAGTLGLVATAGAGVYDQIPNVDLAFPTADQRLYLYLVSMLLLVLGFVEVGTHIRQRREAERQAAERQIAAHDAVAPSVGRHGKAN